MNDLKSLKKAIKGCDFSDDLLRKYLNEEIQQKRYIYEFKKINLLEKNDVIINIGAGRGSLSVIIAKEGFKVDSLEYYSCYAKIISWKYNKNKVKGKIINKAVEQFNSSKKYSVAILTDVIEHVIDPVKSLKKIYALLKPKGKVYLTVPNKYQLKDPHYNLYFICWLPNNLADKILILLKHKKNKCSGNQSLSEMHYYTYSEFKKICETIGFDLIDLRKKEIYNPQLIYPAHKNYIKLVKFFRFFKLSWILSIFIRNFFGHKFILVKK